MAHRDGKKFRGTHTTLLDLAAEVVDLAVDRPEVTGISPGFIRSGQAVAGGTHKVKIGEGVGGLVLTVRQSRSVQEVRILSSDVQATRLALARTLRDKRIPISFGR